MLEANALLTLTNCASSLAMNKKRAPSFLHAPSLGEGHRKGLTDLPAESLSLKSVVQQYMYMYIYFFYIGK